MRKFICFVFLVVTVGFSGVSLNAFDSTYSSNRQSFSNSKQPYSNDESKFKNTYGKGFKGTLNGIPYRDLSDLKGQKVGVVPLVIDGGSKMILNNVLKNFIGSEPRVSFTLKSATNIEFMQHFAEATLKFSDFYKGIAETNPGVKPIEFKYSWIPKNNNRAELKVFYMVTTDTIHPQTGKLIDHFGTYTIKVTMTGTNGGTYYGITNHSSAVQRKYFSAGNIIKIMKWATTGNLLLSQPLDSNIDFSNLNSLPDRSGVDYYETEKDVKSSNGRSPTPIDEDFFANFSLYWKFNGSSGDNKISSIGEYYSVRNLISNGQALINGSDNPRFIPSSEYNSKATLISWDGLPAGAKTKPAANQQYKIVAVGANTDFSQNGGPTIGNIGNVFTSKLSGLKNLKNGQKLVLVMPLQNALYAGDVIAIGEVYSVKAENVDYSAFGGPIASVATKGTFFTATSSGTLSDQQVVSEKRIYSDSELGTVSAGSEDDINDLNFPVTDGIAETSTAVVKKTRLF
jgi:hypothetical protein